MPRYVRLHARRVRILGALQVLAARGVVLPRLALRTVVLGTSGAAVDSADVPAARRPSVPERGSWQPLGPSASAGRVINLVAHPDDDLIFLSPDLLVDLGSADALTTVLLTSGDGGRGALYAAAREEGLRRAYAGACGVANLWEVREHRRADFPFLVDRLCGDPRVSLVFLRLPDGSPGGDGTERGHWQSLKKLSEGQIPYVERLGTSDRVTLEQLVGFLAELLREFRPSETRTLDYTGAFGDGDHSDHLATARVVRMAHARLDDAGDLTGYLGYTTAGLPENLSGHWLARKSSSIETYARCDPAFRMGYDLRWLPRQYVSVRERRRDSRGPSAPGR